MVEQPLHVADVEAEFVQQKQQHARIERAAARAHRQALDRGEAHGRRHALAVVHRAHARAVAEVEDDRAARGGRAASSDGSTEATYS